MIRVLLMALVVTVAAARAAAGAGGEQYAGLTIADVRVEAGGVPFSDPVVIELIETRIGEPLTMLQVRATIDHLVGLGRFEDVRLYAAPSDNGVILWWMLTPVRRITEIDIEGEAGLSDEAIRTEVSDRFGSVPSANRLGEIVPALESFYAGRGYPSAAVQARLENIDGAPERARMVLAITAGARTVIGSARVAGNPRQPAIEVLRELGLETGRVFDRTALDARIAEYEENLRQQGYYEGRVTASTDFSADRLTVNVVAEIAPGPRVRLTFAGDPLPAGDPEDFVPIRAERAVDQDLLEDASRNIEDALRRQGYRTAQAPYSRRQEGEELVVTFTIARGPLHRVQSVDVHGMSGLQRADLAALLQIKAGEPFVEARVAAVATAIAELYRVRGFSQVLVTPTTQLLPSPADGSFRPVDVVLDIREGPQTILGAVYFEGIEVFTAENLRKLMGLTAGKPFYRPQLGADRDTIERAYRNLGFQGVSVISQLSFASDQTRVELTWRVREGDRVTIDRVLISGNVRASLDLIRREMTVGPGDPMSEDALIDSQRRLAATGLFRRVRITEVPRSGSAKRDVLVEVEEAEPTTITVGGGVEAGRRLEREEDASTSEHIDVAPRGFFDITRRNLWGKNRSVTFFARVSLRPMLRGAENTEDTGYGLNDYRVFFAFREPRAFGTAGEAQINAFIEQGLRLSFDFNRRGVSADYARRFEAFTVTGRYTFDNTRLFNERIYDVDQLLIDRIFPQVALSKLFGSVLRDSRDDVINPQRGSVVGVEASVAVKALGSEVGFLKTFMQGFLYRRLPGRGIVLATGARLGLAVGFPQSVDPVFEIAQRRGGLTRRVDAATSTLPEPLRQLPASERFFAGGDNTVRGFDLDRLGTEETLDPEGFPQGGNGLAVFNLEARAPYWKDLQLVWFADAGNVFRLASDLRLDELRVTSGVGVRYRSPIGPLRVDIGVKLSTRLLLAGGREPAGAFHISLGQAF